MATRARLDSEMARRGLAESREGAQRLIMAGRVRVDSRPAAKPDLRVGPVNEITVLPGPREYASRGAYKLLAALDAFRIDPAGRGALDVGYGQLESSLRADPRVVVLDRTNIRMIRAGDLPYQPDLVVIDVSFISLRLVLPVVIEVAVAPADVLALVKPQFEAGRGMVGKGGVVRDELVRRATLEKTLEFAGKIGLEVGGAIDSPIAGAAGNREFMAWFRKS